MVRQRLWHDHRGVLHHIRAVQPLRRQVHRQAWNEEGVPVGDLHLVAWRVPPRRLRSRHLCAEGGWLPRHDGRHDVGVALPRLPCRPCARRSRQLPRGHQGYGGVLPEKGPRVRDVDLQLGVVRRRPRRAAFDSANSEVLRLGVVVHHNRRTWLRMDGLLDVAVQEAGGEQQGQCGGARVYIG